MSPLQARYSEVQDQSLDIHEAPYEGEGFGYHSQYHYAPNPPDLRNDFENKPISRNSERQYKPTALRWPFLLSLLLALLTTLGFLSYAVKSLPVVEFRDASERVEARGLYQSSGLIHTPTTGHKARRTEATTPESVSITSSASFYPQPSDSRNAGARAATESDTSVPDSATTPIPSDEQTPITGTKGSDDFGEIGTKTVTVSDPSSSDEQTPITSTKGSDDFGNIGTKTVTVSDTLPTTETRISGDYGDIGVKTVTVSDSSSSDEQTPITGTKEPSDFGDIGVKTVTVLDPSSSDEQMPITSTKGSDDFGDIGTKTVTVSDSSPTTETRISGDYGNIGTKTVTVSDPGSSDEQMPITGTKGSGDFGDIGTKTVTVSDPSTTKTRISDDYGDIGTKTVTVSDPSDSGIASTQAESDYGRIGTRTIAVSDSSTTPEAGVSEDPSDGAETPTFATTLDQSDYGRVGTKTITEAPPDTETMSATGTTDGQTATIPESDFGDVGSKTVSEKRPGSTTLVETVTRVTLGVTTITDADGSPIATSTRTLSLATSLRTSTLTNSEGRATATQVVVMTVTPSTSVETDSLGNPTATVVTYPVAAPVRTEVYSISGGHYFMGTFLPTVVASILAIAVRILDTNAKAFQPWHALTHERGVSGRDSLCLQTGGWRSLAMGFRSLVGGQAVVFLASLLSLSSALLIPVSAGAVLLDLRGDGCRIGGTSAQNCAYVLSVSPIVSKAAIGILALMSLTTVFLVVMVGRWRLGVYTNPWSMCTLASLSANPDVRRLVLEAGTGADTKQAGTQLKHQDFKLDYFPGAKGQMEYGIVALDRFSGTRLSSTHESEKGTLTSRFEDDDVSRRKHGSPFFMLSIIGRLCLLFMLIGVLVLVLYYARTGGDTAFERFMDSDSFGVQFLFTSLGVIICLFWSAFLGGKIPRHYHPYRPCANVTQLWRS